MPTARLRFRGRARGAVAAAIFAALATALIPAEPQDAQAAAGRYRGVVVTSSQARAQAALGELDRVRAAGADTAALTTFWDADEGSSSVQRGSVAPSDADLEFVIRQARQRGMRVALELMLKCYGCDPPWRGAIRPKNVGAFFNSYRAMVNHYAELSQRHGVELLFVGSEMVTLQVHAEEWREVIRQARARFKGRVAYESNWDSTHTVRFWDAVDVVGVSPYFPLSTAAEPSVAELKAAWHAPRGERAPRGWFGVVEDLARTTGKPVVFGEIGYRSMAHTARAPYDHVTQHPANPVAQLNAYQALLETFDPQPWWGGVMWWEWLVTDGRDTGYTPRGKPAETLLKRWWVEGWRPGGEAPVAAPGGGPASEAAGGGPGAAAGSGGRQRRPGGSSPGSPTAEDQPLAEAAAEGADDGLVLEDTRARGLRRSGGGTPPGGRPEPEESGADGLAVAAGLLVLGSGTGAVLALRTVRRRPTSPPLG